MDRTISALALALALSVGGAVSCADGAPEPSPGRGLAIGVAPLSLDGVADARYTITVQNSAGAEVWSRTIESTRFGDGAGGVTYVGACDADASPNTVSLTLEALYSASGAVFPADSFVNPTLPTPLTLTVPCVEGVDTPVTFNLTIARRAQQGFFDVAVSFSDLFCSAKLDCGATTSPADDLLLLHDPTGSRNTTAVLGFACTPGPEQSTPTYLYMDNLEITCAGTGDTTTVDVTALGKITDLDAPPNSNPDGYLFSAAVYRGDEALANKSYWNVSLGINRAAFASAGACTLSGTASASSAPLANLTTPAATAYPLVRWSAPLSDATGRLCTSHPLDAGPEVQTEYATPAAAHTFTAQYSRGTSIVAVNTCDVLTNPDAVDDFDGSALDAHWDPTAVGGPMTYTVASSKITITDAPYASTPSSPTQSWIYNRDLDLGNQMAWSQPIGTGDFELSFDFTWLSDTPQLTLGGVGFANSAHQIELWSGIADGSSTGVGGPVFSLRRPPGNTESWSGDPASAGTGHVLIRREAGVITMSYDGVERLTAASTHDLATLIIIAVPHRSGSSYYEFGTLEVDRIGLCR